MGLKKIFQHFLLRFDLFSTPACLRYKSQPCYESIQCGIFSLILVGCFIAMFAYPVINVLTKAQIFATTTVTDSLSSFSQISRVKFAVNMRGLSLKQMLQSFQFRVKSIIHTKQGETIEKQAYLVPCTEEAWLEEGENMKKYYDGLQMWDMLCAPEGFKTNLFGSELAEEWSQVEIKINRCKEGILFPCLNTFQFNQIMQNYLDQNDFFDVRILLLDSIIRLENQDPVVKTINRDIFLSFTDLIGSKAEISIGTYEVTTDQSIWPWTLEQTIKGYFLQDKEVISTGLRSDRYAFVRFQKSTFELEAIRNYGKIDDLLAYIGGFFSLIFFVLLFFFASFNEYRYQLMVGERCLSYDGGKTKDVGEGDMGIWGYLCYQIYEWLNMFGIKLKWKKMQKVHKVRIETCEQLDVCYIVRKLQFLEQVIQNYLDKNLVICSSLLRPRTIQQAKIQRKITMYYHSLFANQSNRAIKNILSRQELITQEEFGEDSDQENQYKEKKMVEQELSEPKLGHQIHQAQIPQQKYFRKYNNIDERKKINSSLRIPKNDPQSSRQQKSDQIKNIDPLTMQNISAVLIKSIAEMRNRDKTGPDKKSRNRQRKMSEQQINDRSKKNLNPTSKDILTQDNFHDDYQQQRNCYEKINRFFDDQPDSADEKAERIIYKTYNKVNQRQPHKIQRIGHKIPEQLKKNGVKFKKIPPKHSTKQMEEL